MSNRKLQNERRAFTLVEVLAATAIASLLMVALLGIVAGISRKEKLLTSRDEPAWHAQVKYLLKRDLGSATGYSCAPNSLTLHTCTHRLTASEPWIPVEVVYEVVEVAGKSALVRSERLLQSTEASHSDIVAYGVDQIVLAEAAEDELLANHATTTCTHQPIPQSPTLAIGEGGIEICRLRVILP